MPQTIADINDKIKAGKARVLTATELKSLVAEIGVTQATKKVDVIVTGTFEPMESSGAIINLGHTDPPIKIRSCWLDSVPAYAGFGAVDIYLGATQEPEASDEGVQNRGGGHVIADLIAGKTVNFKAIGHTND
ncbi:MAG: homocysteine biosynthesis protein, partial [Pseudanabaena sp.]